MSFRGVRTPSLKKDRVLAWLAWRSNATDADFLRDANNFFSSFHDGTFNDREIGAFQPVLTPFRRWNAQKNIRKLLTCEPKFIDFKWRPNAFCNVPSAK